MESFIANLPIWGAAAVGILVALVGIAKIITKLTPNTRDDEVVAKIEDVVDKVSGIVGKPESDNDSAK